jgi:hypothetical protein
VPSIRTFAPELPEDLIAIIDRAVEIEPGRRPTAAELADALAGAATPRESPAVETQFVPDATTDRPLGSTPVAIETAFVPDVAPARWKRWAIAAGAVAVLVAIAVIAGRSRPPSLGTTPPAAAADASNPAPEEPALEPPPPGQIRAVTPRMTDRRAAEDWNKVVEELYEQKFGKARKKLDEWERRWGETAETRSLREQLDALPRELLTDD